MCRSVTITALLLNFSVLANGMVNENVVCVLLFCDCEKVDCEDMRRIVEDASHLSC